MNASYVYIAISIVVLALITLLVFRAGNNKKAQRLSPLAGFAFGFVLAGFLFGDERLEWFLRSLTSSGACEPIRIPDLIRLAPGDRFAS